MPQTKKKKNQSNRDVDLHKIFFDDESYNRGHGHLYEHLGISPDKGAIVIVRPDQCKPPS